MWAALSRPRAALARSFARSIRPRTVGRPSPRLSLVRLCQSDDGKPKDEQEPVVVEVVDQDTVEAALAVDDSPFQFPDLLTLGIGRRPLLPGIIHPFKIEDPAIVDAVNAQMQQGQPYIGVFLLRNTVDFTQEGARVPMDESEIYQYGTLAQVVNLAQVKPTDPESDGGESWSLLLQGKRRVNLKEVISAKTDPMMRVSADAPLEKPLDSKSDLVKAYTNEIMSTIKEILKLNPLFKEQLQVFIERVDATRPAQLSDFGAALTTAEASELQHVLEAADVKDRMEKTLFLLKQELELSKLQQTIGREVEAQISKEQRRYMLMQQLKKIKQELGIEKDEKEGVLERYNKRLDELGEVPEHAKSVIDDEMQKLSSLDPSSSEYNVVRNYLDWMTCLPWDSHSTDNFDVEQAKRVLDEDHYGMDDLKERILEFIAMGSLRGDVHGKILILHGPPGVGKTSIGSSIGRALNREFFRFSVGGMSDTSEIKGHRRTYVGAMPGKLIQSLKKTGKGNPIIMIDEIDKLGRSMSGDPSSALLEVLDPEQNGSFVDHYLDVPFDLSKVLFICTANDLDTISRPLLDRMEVLSVGGYVLDEKLQIAQQYLMPRALKEAGLNDQQVDVTPGALTKLIRSYCREAGVRNLQKQIEKIHRKISLKIVRDNVDQVVVNEDNLHDFVGKEIFTSDRLYDQTPPGVVMGLAYTQLGGATLYIETIGNTDNSKPGAGLLQTTGRMGEVMKESSSIAQAYARHFLKEIDAKNDMLEAGKLNMHIPEGATPKDGPSAGVTMTTSLLSLALGQPVKNDLAMTGELTLTGKVLPVGGIKEKTLAAKRSGVTDIILPAANQRDFEELADYVRDGIEVHYASEYQDVFDIAFEKSTRTVL